MNFEKASFGLGLFSIALGMVELVGSRRLARALSVPGSEDVIRTFGFREAAAGVALLQSPAHGARVWNRVVGDGMDLLALGLAARKTPKNKVVWGAVAFVIAASALDVAVALGLDRSTAKTLPSEA